MNEIHRSTNYMLKKDVTKYWFQVHASIKVGE